MIIVSSIFCFTELLSKFIVEFDTDFDTDVLVPSLEYEAGMETTMTMDSTEPAAVATDIVLFGNWSLFAHDDATKTYREFTLEGIGQTSNGYAPKQRREDRCRGRR